MKMTVKRILFAVTLVTLALGLTRVGRVKAGEEFERDEDHFQFYPGNLVVSRSVYDINATPSDILTVGTILPPNCAATTAGCSGAATNDGTYPTVFNNNLVDGSFGVTSKIFLDQLTPFGWRIDSLEVPSNPKRDRLVTSFSSKSEVALNLSTDHKYLTFMGYVTGINQIDVSNSNTSGTTNPTNVDPTNPVGESFERAVAEVDQDGKFEFTETNAYSGNNGRAAIYSHGHGANVYYTAGNAGNGGTPQPNGILLGGGAQIMSPAEKKESAQSPLVPTPVGGFNITELGLATDKIGKDDNFRGMTIYDNVLYYTKGSGGNGVNTVYFVDTVGTACVKTGAGATGVGLPVPGAPLPTSPVTYPANPATLNAQGLDSNMCILAGFPAAIAKNFAGFPAGPNPAFPFGIWFANTNTLYMADEGDGYASGTDLYSHAASSPSAGLQKWVFDAGTQEWKLAYTLQTGLELGTAYTVPGYFALGVLNPANVPPATETINGKKKQPNPFPSPGGLPWDPATDGLRNITGRVDWDGKVTIWGITSTVSGSGDQGADPNRLVAITDILANTDPAVAAMESFRTLRTAEYGEVLRGVSFAPGTEFDHDHDRDDHDHDRDRDHDHDDHDRR